MNILIVDDDERFCMAVRRFLVSRGHTIRVAVSAKAALDSLETEPVELVLCDVHLPGMSGLEFLRHCRVQFPDLPVTITTGDRDLDNAVTAFRGGALDYLKKPIDLRALLVCIESVARDGHVER
ncbi:MAG: response regulator [Bacteroidetes bacterium]|nr:response regulator [Bacteroidota bacterium]